MQYLRARCYDQDNGRFNRVDPFGGNNSDPQSLHKYAYCHGDPVMGIDPSGEMSILNVMATVSGIATFATTFLSGVAAGKNPVYATITGIAGGLSIGFLIATKNYKKLLKAFVAGALASVLSLIVDKLFSNKSSISNYMFDFLESFSWSAFNSSIMVKSKNGLSMKDALYQANLLEYMAQHMSKLIGDIFTNVNPAVAQTLVLLRVFSDTIAGLVVAFLNRGLEKTISSFLPKQTAKSIMKKITQSGVSSLHFNSPSFRAKIGYNLGLFSIRILKKFIGNKSSDMEADLKKFYYQY
jgi:hypothetical protein